MNDNLFFDKENKIKIFSNDLDFFVIEKFDFWKNSIIIKFNLYDEINYINLFFILKSYACFKKIQPFAICSLFSVEERLIITQKSNIQWYINMDYFMFKDWLNFRIKTDEKYDDNSNFFGLVFLYSKDLIFIYQSLEYDILSVLKPKYPWTKEVLLNFEGQIEKIEILENKVKILEKELNKKK